MERTPEEIKKVLECCYGDEVKRLCDQCPNAVRVEGYPEVFCGDFDCSGKEALALIQQLEAQVPKWISVEERLPEEVMRDESDVSSSDLVIVAVCDDMDNIFVADDIVCRGEWVNYPAPLFEVTHWMPLPEPPKEG